MAWGSGWCVGVVGASIGLALSVSGASWILYPLVPVVGAISFGFPSYVGARRARACHPIAQAIIWIIGFTAAALVLAQFYVASTRLASPGDLNINTTETMRRRVDYIGRFGHPPEVVFAAAFVLAVLVAFAAGCGFLSGLTATSSARGFNDTVRALVFGGATCVAVFTGLLLLVVGGPYLVHLMSVSRNPRLELAGFVLGVVASGFVSGCASGAIVETARRALLRPSE
jgi:hypothetical protein